MAKQQYTPEEVIAALEATNGLVFLAAERLGCTSQTICNYQLRYASVRKAVLEKRGKRLDVGEAALDRAVEAGEAWAIQFLLRTQGKDRGYVERTEYRQVSDADIDAEITAELARVAASRQIPLPGSAASDDGPGHVGGPFPGPGNGNGTSGGPA